MTPGKFADLILQRLENAASQGLSRVATLKGLKPAAPVLRSLAKLIEEGQIVESDKRLYAKSGVPSPERAAGIVREILQSHPSECLSAAQIKKRAPKWVAPKVEKILKELVAAHEVARLKAGRGHLFVHRNAVALWFPASQAPTPPTGDSSGLLKRVLNSYRSLIETRGGFRTVPISELRIQAKVELAELHQLIRAQIQARRANIYRSSSALTPQSVLDAAMRLNNDPEPYVSVEFYD